MKVTGRSSLRLVLWFSGTCSNTLLSIWSVHLTMTKWAQNGFHGRMLFPATHDPKTQARGLLTQLGGQWTWWTGWWTCLTSPGKAPCTSRCRRPPPVTGPSLSYLLPVSWTWPQILPRANKGPVRGETLGWVRPSHLPDRACPCFPLSVTPSTLQHLRVVLLEQLYKTSTAFAVGYEDYLDSSRPMKSHTAHFIRIRC